VSKVDAKENERDRKAAPVILLVTADYTFTKTISSANNTSDSISASARIIIT
jgi:hypothetical protein